MKLLAKIMLACFSSDEKHAKRPLFSKKRRKNFCYSRPWAVAAPTPMAQIQKSLFGSFFFQKKNCFLPLA
jgi:hypothetical protein